MNKTILSILKVLNRSPDTIIGSREISKQLTEYGIDLTERTVRYHLRILDERGYTTVFGKEGRKITEKGKEELDHSHVSEKVGFVISRIETLSYLTSLDLETMDGKIIMNISYFPEGDLSGMVEIIRQIFQSPYVMSDRLILRRGGEKIGDILIPEGKIGVGTVCSVTINGHFFKGRDTGLFKIRGRFGNSRRKSNEIYLLDQL